jgi:hypothetical protein
MPVAFEYRDDWSSLEEGFLALKAAIRARKEN